MTTRYRAIVIDRYGILYHDFQFNDIKADSFDLAMKMRPGVKKKVIDEGSEHIAIYYDEVTEVVE